MIGVAQRLHPARRSGDSDAEEVVNLPPRVHGRVCQARGKTRGLCNGSDVAGLQRKIPSKYPLAREGAEHRADLAELVTRNWPFSGKVHVPHHDLAAITGHHGGGQKCP